MKTPCSKCEKTVDEHYRTASGLIACGEPPKAKVGFLHFATSFYMPASYAAGFEAGLRRAQELAKETIESRHGGLGFTEFDQAIDDETKKS